MVWLDGAYSRRFVDRRPGLAWRKIVPFRFVIHSTEGDGYESALREYDKGTGCPHLTVEYRRDVRLQHVPLDKGAYALRNDPGGVQTNAIPCVQIEWVGRAGNGRDKKIEELEWFGEILADCANGLLDAQYIPTNFELVWPEFFDDKSGFTLARKNSKQRKTDAEWYSGRWSLYGHQHVPENSHWDPGLIGWPHVDRSFDLHFKGQTSRTPPTPPVLDVPFDDRVDDLDDEFTRFKKSARKRLNRLERAAGFR